MPNPLVGGGLGSAITSCDNGNVFIESKGSSILYKDRWFDSTSRVGFQVEPGKRPTVTPYIALMRDNINSAPVYHANKLAGGETHAFYAGFGHEGGVANLWEVDLSDYDFAKVLYIDESRLFFQKAIHEGNERNYLDLIIAFENFDWVAKYRFAIPGGLKDAIDRGVEKCDGEAF